MLDLHAGKAETPLERARRHVRDAEASVARQATLLQRLRDHSHGTAQAEALLRTLLQTLTLARDHLANMEQEERIRE